MTGAVVVRMVTAVVVELMLGMVVTVGTIEVEGTTVGTATEGSDVVNDDATQPGVAGSVNEPHQLVVLRLKLWHIYPGNVSRSFLRVFSQWLYVYSNPEPHVPFRHDAFLQTNGLWRIPFYTIDGEWFWCFNTTRFTKLFELILAIWYWITTILFVRRLIHAAFDLSINAIDLGYSQLTVISAFKYCQLSSIRTTLNVLHPIHQH